MVTFKFCSGASRWSHWIFGCGAALLFLNSTFGADSKSSPGLINTFAVDGKSDVTSAPNVWLYVEAGQSPSPFLPAGKFTATWEGALSIELRGEYIFRAELRGTLQLELNGTNVLDATGADGSPSAPTKAVKLNKGANKLKAIFTSPASGAASVRLEWSEKGVLWEPLPVGSLDHVTSAELQNADKLRFGRELFLEHRCVKCHLEPNLKSGLPELAMDAPDLEGIGSRRKFNWLARWIENPKSSRPTARMPRVFHGEQSKEDGKAIAAFLTSLKSSDTPGAPPKADLAEAGGVLATKLHCDGCHDLPGDAKIDEQKISLRGVAEKFAEGRLVPFLLDPAAHYAWIRMPNFKLSGEEAEQLAAFLIAGGGANKEDPAPVEPALIERGKKLVQTSGCLNCHNLKLENQFHAVAAADLKWKNGCLAASLDNTARAVVFGFTPGEIEALQAFGATDRQSLGRHGPVEFAERQTRLLNCRACHGQLEGFPALEILGGKLKPEWSGKFIAGQITLKPRHWLEQRMPGFSRRAEFLAKGLAQEHGYAPQTPTEPPIDQELAKVGRKLSSAEGGFSCISCHGIGAMAPTQVFESEGINFAQSGERLLPQYFRRWVRNPPRMDPNTKMPVYFDDEGKSPLAEILGGDAARQIDALWNYIRLGKDIPPPGQ